MKTNWTKGLDAKGQPIPNPGEGTADRRRARLAESGWRRRTGRRQASARDTGLFYANATRGFSVYYLYENENDEKPQGWGGNDRGGWSEAMLQAIDYKTGKIEWTTNGRQQRTSARVC